MKDSVRWTVDPNTPMGCVVGLAAAGIGSLIGTAGGAWLIVTVLEAFR
jgi:hypothetical protein